MLRKGDGGMEIQLIHKAELMEPDGFDGDVEQHRHLLRSTVLRNQLQHFSLTRSEGGQCRAVAFLSAPFRLIAGTGFQMKETIGLWQFATTHRVVLSDT